MSNIQLSICIPTYQRAAHIQDVLESLCEIDLNMEVLISDNASQDNTEEVVLSFASRLNIRYVRQQTNIGAEANLISAFRLACGELCVYLADDDRLIVDGLKYAMQRLLEKPSRAAVLAPWEDWDAREGVSMGMHYVWPVQEEGDQPDPVTMLKRFVSNNGFPEIGVYRTRLLHKVLCLPHQVYWAHPWITRLSGQGEIYLQRQPFYRSVARTKSRRDRLRLGVMQTMMFQDRYRGGLEVALWEGLRQTGASHLPIQDQHLYTRVVETLQASRLKTGAYLSKKLHDEVRAVEFGRRAKLYLPDVMLHDEEAGRLMALRDRKHLLENIVNIFPSVQIVNPELSICVLYDNDPIALANSLASIDMETTECLVVSQHPIDTPDPRIRYVSSPELCNEDRRRLVGLFLASGRYVGAFPAGATVCAKPLSDALLTLNELPECCAWMTTYLEINADTVAFHWNEAMEQFIHLLSADFHPNCCIFRRDGLDEVLLPTQTFSSAWQWWWVLARQGQICFSPTPWFNQLKAILESPDTLRGALELYLYEVLEHQSLKILSLEEQNQVRILLDQRLMPCLYRCAIEFSERGDALGALEFLARRQLWLGIPHPLKPTSSLIDMAALQLVKMVSQQTAHFKDLLVCGMSIPFLKDSPIVTEEALLAHPPTAIVLVPDIACAERLRRVFLPGCVLVWSELRQLVERLI